jgi:hypothetical protein
VLNVLVTKKTLNEASVGTAVSQVIATGVTKHVWVNGELVEAGRSGHTC